jgi:hypothetical protein
MARRERVIHSTIFKGIERDAIAKEKEYCGLIIESEKI